VIIYQKEEGNKNIKVEKIGVQIRMTDKTIYQE